MMTWTKAGSLVVLVVLTGCLTPPEEVSTFELPSSSESSTSSPKVATSTDPTDDAGTGGSSSGAGLEGTSSTSASASTRGDESTTSSDSGQSQGESSSSGDPQPDCFPQLAEILYNPTGEDDSEEWLKLYNPCNVDIDLQDYSLGWGGNTYAAGTADLSGTIASGDCFILGGPNSHNGNNNPVFNLVLDFGPPNLGNAEGDTADAVGLFMGAASEINARSVPVDAVIYGANNFNNFIDASGIAVPPHVDPSPAQGDSIRRTADVPVTWIDENNPMPALCPPYSG